MSVNEDANRKDQSNSSLVMAGASLNYWIPKRLNNLAGFYKKYSEIFEFMKNNNLFKRESQHHLLCGCDFLGD